jgi:hypothetical protein
MKPKDKQALETILSYVITMANEHSTPCDAMTECGECFICEQYENVPAAFKALGVDISEMP